MDTLSEYLESSFYQKYKDTYYSDCILKDVLGQDITKHVNDFDSYDAVFDKNVQVMRDFVAYVDKSHCVDEYNKWLMLHCFYIDPEVKAVKKAGDIDCIADGLMTIMRLYKVHGMTSTLVNEYEKYRKMPIFYFPNEVNGISMARERVFGDRIDHTLYDIKRACEGAGDCYMKEAYELPKTREWLKYFGNDFSRIVDWLGIGEIFVNSGNEVFDLEKNDGSVIEGYLEEYSWEWSSNYYDNVASKVAFFRESKESRFSL